MKRINRARYEQLRDRFEKQEFLAMMIPSILPPPTPWKLFVICGGGVRDEDQHFPAVGLCRPDHPQPGHSPPDDRIRAGDRKHRWTFGDPAPVPPGGRGAGVPCRAGLLDVADGLENVTRRICLGLIRSWPRFPSSVWVQVHPGVLGHSRPTLEGLISVAWAPTTASWATVKSELSELANRSGLVCRQSVDSMEPVDLKENRIGF